jgi:stringent starvation protein B
MAEISTKPYLIRAIHEWCEDSGFRPYIAVVVDEHTQVPVEFVRNGEIVLNISGQATHRLRIGNELIEFEARFSGTVRSVSIPIDNVSAIYAQETGHGMAFEVVRIPTPRPVVGKTHTATVSSDLEATPVSAPAPARPPASGPRLVPRPARSPSEDGTQEPVPGGAESIQKDPGATITKAPAKTPRGGRRRASSGAPDAQSEVAAPGSAALRALPGKSARAPESASVSRPPSSVEPGVVEPGPAVTEPVEAIPSVDVSPDRGDRTSPPEPVSEGPDRGPAKPPRGHLKRVK